MRQEENEKSVRAQKLTVCVRMCVCVRARVKVEQTSPSKAVGPSSKITNEKHALHLAIS